MELQISAVGVPGTQLDGEHVVPTLKHAPVPQVLDWAKLVSQPVDPIPSQLP